MEVAQLPSHSFSVDDPNDHCETPKEAYAHLKPVLDTIQIQLSSSAKLYDPYFCTGAVVRHLGAVGYQCINKNRDFYADIRTASIPAHDVVVTNPPFSGDHPQRLLEWLVSRHSPAVVKTAAVGGAAASDDTFASISQPQKRPRLGNGAALRSRNMFAALDDSDGDDNDGSSSNDAQGASRGGEARRKGDASSSAAAAPPPSDGFAPWCALLPQYIANKPWFHVLRKELEREAQSKGWAAPLLYIGPTRDAYGFSVPAGARPVGESPSTSAGPPGMSKIGRFEQGDRRGRNLKASSDEDVLSVSSTEPADLDAGPAPAAGKRRRWAPLDNWAGEWLGYDVGDNAAIRKVATKLHADSAPQSGSSESTSAQPLAVKGSARSSASAPEAAAIGSGGASAAAPVRAGSFQCVWFVGGLGARGSSILQALGAACLLSSANGNGSAASTGLGDAASAASEAAGNSDVRFKLLPGTGGEAAIALSPLCLPQLTLGSKATPAERRWKKRKEAKSRPGK